jgi:hypothetical protein
MGMPLVAADETGQDNPAFSWSLAERGGNTGGINWLYLNGHHKELFLEPRKIANDLLIGVCAMDDYRVGPADAAYEMSF